MVRRPEDTRRPDDRDQRRPADLPLTLGVFVAILAALMPVLGVVKPWPWLGVSLLLVILILGAGYVARRYRLPAVAVSLIEVSIWAVALTFLYFRDTALLWLIPTPETFRAIPESIAVASNDIALGAAPLQAGPELSFLIVGATALLAIIIDHVVLTARMPLLAGVGLIAVSLIPSIAVPRGIEVWSFVLLAGAILFLIRADTRSREPQGEREASRSAGVPATALGIGAIAVVVAVVAAPLLPQPTAQPGGAGIGAGPGIDVTLQLGDDLRRPRETVSLLVHTDMSSAPYLRAATLSEFTGSVWQPDRSRSLPLGSEFALSDVSVEPDVRVAEYTTTVEVRDLVSPWLPVTFPAVAVNGLQGDWEAVPYNRTVLSRTTSTAGQVYEIVSHQPRPTLEQMRAANSGGPQIRDDTTALPDDLPTIIRDTAQEVTANATNDYDALAELQRWFRGGAFRYSLDAPVEDGFDGSGADAVAKFLDVKEGYCVHFASAFALMARTLGMPSRIVVGYLPGNATNDSVDGETVYEVTSSMLHSWPEVYFDGIGWVPFEPTTGLGVPTTFAPAATSQGSADNPQDSPLEPSTSATPDLPESDRNTGDSGTTDASSTTTSMNPLPSVGIVIVILLFLAIPAVLRAVQTRSLLRAAEQGDAVAAWLVVVDAAIDLGIPVPASESPRSLGRRLIDESGAPLAQTTQLVRAIERASYAQGGKHRLWESTPLSDAATAVRTALFENASSAQRLVAVMVPRSLVIRPGSVYAGAGARARSRSRS
ncbi:transglutaminase family protein [Microbacterium sp. F51-2R]|uniref:transglutaminase family protein n=1 Tax=Microbacterium sp. F51-2R TaxID=3445777 RepID=UPI003FA062A1